MCPDVQMGDNNVNFYRVLVMHQQCCFEKVISIIKKMKYLVQKSVKFSISPTNEFRYVDYYQSIETKIGNFRKHM